MESGEIQSELPCFTTDAAMRAGFRDVGDDRVSIPITDSEVDVSFYLAANPSQKTEKLFAKLER